MQCNATKSPAKLPHTTNKPVAFFATFAPIVLAQGHVRMVSHLRQNSRQLLLKGARPLQLAPSLPVPRPSRAQIGVHGADRRREHLTRATAHSPARWRRRRHPSPARAAQRRGPPCRPGAVDQAAQSQRARGGRAGESGRAARAGRTRGARRARCAGAATCAGRRRRATAHGAVRAPHASSRRGETQTSWMIQARCQ